MADRSFGDKESNDQGTFKTIDHMQHMNGDSRIEI